MEKFVLGTLIALTGATCAVAADLYYKAPVAVPVYNWTGFYIGGNVGGAWGSFDPRTVSAYSDDGWDVPTDFPAMDRVGIQSSKPTGFTGGFEAGYNWQSRNFVFGVEGDIEALSLSSRVSGSALYPGYPYTFTITSNIGTTWLATVRGRLGYAVNNWLIFATGGAAFTDLHGSFAFFDSHYLASQLAIPMHTNQPSSPIPRPGIQLAVASRRDCGAIGPSRANISTPISEPFRRAATI